MLIIASTRNNTRAAIAFWTFLGLTTIVLVLLYFIPDAYVRGLDKVHIKFTILLIVDLFILLALLVWYYSSMVFSPIEYARFLIKFFLWAGFVSSASPFGLAGVELLAARSDEAIKFNLRAAVGASGVTLVTFFLMLLVLLGVYTLLHWPPVSRWAIQRLEPEPQRAGSGSEG